MNKEEIIDVEFERLSNIIKAGMYSLEVNRFLGARLNEYADQLGVSGRTRPALSSAIVEALTATEPDSVKPDTKSAPCAGCPADYANSDLLRWRKAATGRQVTWSVDKTDMPRQFTLPIIESWPKAWEKVCGIKHQYVDGIGDIHIRFDAIDGPGKTLGFVWQPSGDVTSMESGGSLIGDMTIDSSERDWPHWLVMTMGMHEWGHAIGIPHSEFFGDLMFGSILFQNKIIYPQSRDIKKAVNRYGEAL